MVGSINETSLYDALVADASVRTQPVATLMQPAFPFVDISTSIEALATMITPDNPAVLVRDFACGETFIVTRADVIQALA
jgi:cystathionine beta-synthase